VARDDQIVVVLPQQPMIAETITQHLFDMLTLSASAAVM
jgi:hypothetical protein